MADHTPPDLTPPDQPLDDATRARIRQRVAAASSPSRPEGTAVRRWLVPLAASAAVAVLVVGGVALGHDGDGRQVAPAGSASPAVEPTPPGDATESSSGTLSDATETPTEAEAGRPRPALVPTPTDLACGTETARELPRASEGVSAQGPAGTTTFYVAGDTWTLCHSVASTVTVHHPKPLVGAGRYNPYEISTDFLDGNRAVMVAGGPVPADSPDFGVSYTFSDGHVEDATVVGDPGARLWWLMVYEAPDSGAAIDAPPTVTVRGAPPAPPLGPTDVCAQINHGC